MTTTLETPDSSTQPRRNPLPFGLCWGLIVSAAAMLAVHGANFLAAASDPPGTLERGLSLGVMSALLQVALLVGGLAGLIGGLALADRRPVLAARLESAVYVRASVAAVIVLGNLFLLYFISA